MSQVSHPTIPIRSQLAGAPRSPGSRRCWRWSPPRTVVLVIAIDDGSSSTSSVAGQSQPALRTDGGPDESGRRRVGRLAPEHRLEREPVAAAVGGGGSVRATGGPDESSVAASLSKSPAQQRARRGRDRGRHLGPLGRPGRAQEEPAEGDPRAPLCS